MNTGLPFDSALLKIQINENAINQQAMNIVTRRKLNREARIDWLLRAVQCTDLTTLAGDDTPGFVKQLCYKAKKPLSEFSISVAAVCVYPALVKTALSALGDRNIPIPVAAVAAGFPAGLTHLQARLQEIEGALRDGASEIDIVINRGLVLQGRWLDLYEEIRAFRTICASAHLKVILGTGELGSLQNVFSASLVAMLAGADFIKTSTGKETINATLPVGLTMLRAISLYKFLFDQKIGFKPAGGIRHAQNALDWLILVNEVLGQEWLTPQLFRLGASSLIDDIAKQLA